MLGVRPPSMYHREPLCTPLICQRLHVPSTVKGQVDHTISRRCAAEYAPAARILCSTLRHGGRRRGAPRTHRPVAASSCAFNAQCAPGTRCGSGRSRPRRHCPAPRLGPLRAHANTASVAEQRTRTVAWPPDRGRVLSASRAHLPAAARTRQPADIFAKQSLTPLTHAPPSQVTLRAGTSWSQVIDGVQCRVNVVRERGKLALMVTAGIGSGLDYDKFRITCPRAPSRTHSFAHRGYRIAAFCLGKCMLPCANCQNFLHGSRLSALAAVRYSPRGGRRKKLRQNAQNWDFTVSYESATLIESRTRRPAGEPS